MPCRISEALFIKYHVAVKKLVRKNKRFYLTCEMRQNLLTSLSGVVKTVAREGDQATEAGLAIGYT
jgi:hypothetical protein